MCDPTPRRERPVVVDESANRPLTNVPRHPVQGALGKSHSVRVEMRSNHHGLQFIHPQMHTPGIQLRVLPVQRSEAEPDLCGRVARRPSATRIEVSLEHLSGD